MIPFTQYLLPRGRKKQITVTRPPEIEKMAQAIIDAGYWFECEVLHTGECSFTITNDEADHAVQVCQNGPNVPETIDKLVTRFHATLGGQHGHVVI
jgi:isoaspartyl peptidase/L-asparaginase-like protein (Ntn-hydrolase superfamily)